MIKIEMSCKDVFNCCNLFPNDFYTCLDKVRACGYRYMAFNGRVYSTKTNSMDDVYTLEECVK